MLASSSSRSARALASALANRTSMRANISILGSNGGSFVGLPSDSDGDNGVGTASVTPRAFQQRYYSRSTPSFKIFKLGDEDISPEEMEKIFDDEMAKIEKEETEKQYLDWKPGLRKRPVDFTIYEDEYERTIHPEKFVDDTIWTLRDKRCGALAIKVGMMPVWDEWAVRHPCTVLLLDRNVVLGHKTKEKHGYSAVQVAAGERKVRRVSKAVRGQYEDVEELHEAPPYLVREFRISDEEYLLPIKSHIHARHFVPGQNVDISGISKGKGFQGGIKRHGFGGMPASHGTSRSHRAIGSTGSCQDPGKVFKGKKMAGRMGSDRITTQNLRILKIDRGRNLLYVIGAVPGLKGGFVEIRDAIKKPMWRTDKILGSLKRPPLPTFQYEAAIDGSGEAGHEEFMPLGDLDPLDADYGDTQIALKSAE